MMPATTALLLPGMDGTGALFGPFVEVLPPWLQPVPLGYPATTWSYDEIESLVADQLARLRPRVLLAESFSGPVALRLAARKPAGLEAVVLVATFACCPKPELSWLRTLVRPALFALPPPARLVRELMLARDTGDELVLQVLEAIRAVPPAVMAGRLREVISVDARESLVRSPVPLVLVEATRDRLVPPSLSRAAQASGAPVHRIEVEGPHLLLQCRPRQVAAAVVPVLEGLLRG